MCGIAAIIHPRERTSHAVDVRRMTELLRHRGDSDIAVASFAHASIGSARLRIVDPDLGNQPMEDHEFAVVFNGEIYNHLMLREELKRIGAIFRTGCDTEVLLHGFRHWGSSLQLRLQGMYAFVIVNKSTGEFYAARDRFGIKPLFYAAADGAWQFCSEIGPLLDLPQELIKDFPPNSQMTNGILHASPEISAPSVKIALDKSIELVREKFSASVERHLPPGDERVAIFCSGGIDSSALAFEAVEACKRNGWNPRDKLALYSIGTSSSEDPKFAESLACQLDLPFVLEVIVAEQLVHTVDDAISVIESFEPNHIRAGTASLALARRVHKDGYRIALVGEGADELLGGYEEFPDAVRRGAIDEAKELLSLFTRQLHLTQLRRVDRTTMRYGVEARVPFLDDKFAQFVMSLPIDHKIHRDDDGTVVGKYVLREAYRGLLPDEIVDRRKVPMGEGAGIGDNRPTSGLFDDQADFSLSNSDYSTLLQSYPQFKLRTKEEAFYFSLFLTKFGSLPLATERPTTNVMATT